MNKGCGWEYYYYYVISLIPFPVQSYYDWQDKGGMRRSSEEEEEVFVADKDLEVIIIILTR